MRPKHEDLLVLIGLNIFAIIVSFGLHTSFFVSTILFLGLPSLYLIYMEKKHFKKIFIASVTFGVFFSFIIDFLAEINKAWDWGEVAFGKILGVVQIDVAIWFFLWIFHIFLFYEHFIDRKKSRPKVTRRDAGVLLVSALSVAALVTVYYLYPSVLHFDKAYFWICFILSIPFWVTLFVRPRLVWRSLPVLAYFFFVYLSHEVTALHLDQWRFPGDYFGLVHMLGVSFPIEELVFWVILSSLICSIYYELFFDNRKN